MDGQDERGTAPWFTYLIECSDGSLYCGATADLWRRFVQHAEGRGARYTRARGVVGLRWACEVGSRSEALKLEARLKRQPARVKRLMAGL